MNENQTAIDACPPMSTDLCELMIEAQLAIDKGLRIGHYCMEAGAEIARLRTALMNIAAKADGRDLSGNDAEHMAWYAKTIIGLIKSKPEFLRYREDSEEGFICPTPLTCQFPRCDCGRNDAMF